MNRYVTSRLAGERERIRKANEKEPFYLEHFGADLTTADSHDIYNLTARAMAEDAVTASQPSREVRRQAGSRWAFYALCAVAVLMALIIASWLASYSSSVVNVMLEQVETKGAW